MAVSISDQLGAAMSSVNTFRLHMLRHMAGLPSFQDSWPAWQPLIEREIRAGREAQGIYELGEKLGDVFRGNVVTGRDNSALSAGGKAWECLVCWYMNLVFYGTDVVVILPTRQHLPQTLRNALTVNMANVPVNTESDLVAFNVRSRADEGQYDLSEIDAAISQEPLNTQVSVIQCKTNWNDSAQIPMLWDLIYSQNSFRMPNVSVGTGGISPASFRSFTYSFVTVPTSRGPYVANKLCVLRVRHLSGGNYWGRPSIASVARSINEFFTSNYADSFAGTVQQSINDNVVSKPEILDKFLQLNF